MSIEKNCNEPLSRPVGPSGYSRGYQWEMHRLAAWYFELLQEWTAPWGDPNLHTAFPQIVQELSRSLQKISNIHFLLVKILYGPTIFIPCKRVPKFHVVNLHVQPYGNKDFWQAGMLCDQIGRLIVKARKAETLQSTWILRTENDHKTVRKSRAWL